MSYSRNKYRCLLKPNVIVSLDNNIKNQYPQGQNRQGPQPHIYPYSYPGYPYDYGYPGYGYPYGYPGYGPYGYSDTRYPGYPNIYPYVSKDPEPKESEPKEIKKPKSTKRPIPHYYSSSSSSSSDDSYRYRRNHITKVGSEKSNSQLEHPNYEVDKSNSESLHSTYKHDSSFNTHVICEPEPQPERVFDEVKREKNFVKPLAKLLIKLTNPGDSLGKIEIDEKNGQIKDGDTKDGAIEDGKKIYLKP